jgi:hypothetical protein
MRAVGPTISHESLIICVPCIVQRFVMRVSSRAIILDDSFWTVQNRCCVQRGKLSNLLIECRDASKQLTSLVVHSLGPESSEASKFAKSWTQGDVLIERAISSGSA